MKVLRLKEFRKRAKMTQNEVASALNVTQAGYSLWEQGKRTPSIDQIIKLCELYNCTPNDLFGIHGALAIAIDPLHEKGDE